MSLDFSQYLDALDDSPFEETPVDLDTFLGEGYLTDGTNTLKLSEVQRNLVECMSQIFTLDDCQRIYGHIEGIKHYQKYTKNEVVMQIGKGGGKDFSSVIGCAYLVYKLLCLRDPAQYWNKPAGDAIDIINIAINADQARNVFFKGLKNRIEHAPWFAGKFDPKTSEIRFDKNVTVYSGHSERESHEGLNLIMAILDEISGFAQASDTDSPGAKTAEAIYTAFKGSVDSRFPTIGKTILLSFPRFKGDFITAHYDSVIKEKDVVPEQYTYIIDPEKPGTPENTLTITWERDIVKECIIPSIYAVKATSWEANPGRDIEDYKNAFVMNAPDAYQRFACKPQAIEGGMFKDHEMLAERMQLRNPIDEFTRLEESWTPKSNVRYFLHADLAQKHDRAAVAMAHVTGWVDRGVIADHHHIVPNVVVDFVAFWTPKPGQPLDLKAIANWIIGLKRRGIPISLVTSDRWAPLDFMKQLNKLHIKTDTLSVSKKHYEDLLMLVHDDRVLMPKEKVLLDELKNLQIINDKKVDHPRSGCFVGETKIKMPFGPDIRIEDLDGVEANVFAADPQGNVVVALARGRYTKHVTTLVEVSLRGVSYRCTPEHPWMLNDMLYIEAQHLKPGHCLGSWKETVVESVRFIELDEPVPVYDLEVDDYHNFALSAGVFVHNSKDLADAVAGAAYNAIAYTPKTLTVELDVHASPPVELEPEENFVREVPPEIAQWLKEFYYDKGPEKPASDEDWTDNIIMV